MEKQRDSFIFYRSFYEAVKNLKASDKVKIYDAIFELALNMEEVELSGIPSAIFTLIKPQLEANNKRYANGNKPKLKQNTSKSEANSKQNTSKSEANKNDNVNENDNDNEKNKRITRKKYGEYSHVLLNDAQYDELKSKYNNHEELIKHLDEYIEMKGYKATNHYLAIKKWVVDAVNEKSSKKISNTIVQDFSNEEKELSEKERQKIIEKLKNRSETK